MSATTTTDAMVETVRNADPIVGTEAQQWSSSPDARRRFDDIVTGIASATSGVGGDVIALRPSRRRRAVWIGASAVVAGALATGAAASGLLGEPAPDPIRADIAAVDQGLPEDLRANPDVANAMAVASTPSAVLFAADVTSGDGGYCYEIASDGDRPRGAVCVNADDVGDLALDITSPIPSSDSDALIVAGRINDARVDHLVARYTDGSEVAIEVGLARYWMLEVPESARAGALDDGFDIVGLGADGQAVATAAIGPMRDEDPDGRLDPHGPIDRSTISDDDDLTLVLGIHGTVNADTATTLELQYPDGTIIPIELAADRSFRFDLPADRQDDFAEAWGQLVARDANGDVVATDSFSSVANIRRGM